MNINFQKSTYLNFNIIYTKFGSNLLIKFLDMYIENFFYNAYYTRDLPCLNLNKPSKVLLKYKLFVGDTLISKYEELLL